MLTARKVSLLLTYLVSVGCFFALYGIADDTYFLFLAFIFTLGILNEWRFHVYLPRWLLNVGGIFISLVFLLELSFENVVKPFANMLLLLLAIKSIEEKKPRDIYQMLLLSLFGIAVSTTFRLDLSFLLFFIYELFLGSVAFLFTNAYANMGDKPIPSEFLRKYLRFSFLFPLLIALSTVPFFLILPRTQTPLFDLFAKREKGLVSGIANEVELGKVGEVQQDNTVAFRVYGDLPPDPYWRVSVFDTLVNTKWIKTLREEEPYKGKGLGTFRYRIILEPTYDTFLPLMDYPLKVLKLEGLRMARVKRLKGGYYESSQPINRPVRLEAISSLDPPADPPVPVYLSVPEDVPRSIRSLARKLSEGKRSDEEKLEAVRSFFSKDFSYSLKLSKPEGDPIEFFLFKSRRGNCEFFASSTALLLRLMGIPARVVGGFKGYIKNDYGNYYIVTNSMAHVWVEAYIKGRWVRVDTTPPYTSPAVRKISKLSLIRDALISFWYENVVDFSAQKQLSLFRELYRGIRSLSAEDIKRAFIKSSYIFGVVILLYSLISLYRRLRKTPENLYRALISKLSRYEGMDLRRMMPEEVLRLTAGKPYQREASFIVELYLRYRFSPYTVSKKELREAYRLLRKI